MKLALLVATLLSTATAVMAAVPHHRHQPFFRPSVTKMGRVGAGAGNGGWAPLICPSLDPWGLPIWESPPPSNAGKVCVYTADNTVSCNLAYGGAFCSPGPGQIVYYQCDPSTGICTPKDAPTPTPTSTSTTTSTPTPILAHQGAFFVLQKL